MDVLRCSVHVCFLKDIPNNREGLIGLYSNTMFTLRKKKQSNKDTGQEHGNVSY